MQITEKLKNKNKILKCFKDRQMKNYQEKNVFISSQNSDLD